MTAPLGGRLAGWLERAAGWTGRRRRVAAASASPPSSSVEPHGHGDAGGYGLLHVYLRDRYANRVVLTFGEIESLVGFSLPDPARRQLEWWGTAAPGVHRSAQSDSWGRAKRTATVNLAAQSVVFERQP